jgi:hypothetical protein
MVLMDVVLADGVRRGDLLALAGDRLGRVTGLSAFGGLIAVTVTVIVLDDGGAAGTEVGTETVVLDRVDTIGVSRAL